MSTTASARCRKRPRCRSKQLLPNSDFKAQPHPARMHQQDCTQHHILTTTTSKHVQMINATLFHQPPTDPIEVLMDSLLSGIILRKLVVIKQAELCGAKGPHATPVDKGLLSPGQAKGTPRPNLYIHVHHV
jgi:hypothetical protein